MLELEKTFCSNEKVLFHFLPRSTLVLKVIIISSNWNSHNTKDRGKDMQTKTETHLENGAERSRGFSGCY